MKLKTDDEIGFIKMLADESSKAIMELTSEKEHSALQLSLELDIPPTTIYRKLKLLEDAKLIQNVKTLVDRAGNEEKYYRCRIKEAVVKFSGGKVLIKIDKIDYRDKLVTLWKRLSRPEE